MFVDQPDLRDHVDQPARADRLAQRGEQDPADPGVPWVPVGRKQGPLGLLAGPDLVVQADLADHQVAPEVWEPLAVQDSVGAPALLASPESEALQDPLGRQDDQVRSFHSSRTQKGSVSLPRYATVHFP